jgi:hypothetical protein
MRLVEDAVARGDALGGGIVIIDGDSIAIDTTGKATSEGPVLDVGIPVEIQVGGTLLAAAALRLEEAGKIDLDRPFSDYVGDVGFEGDASGITIRQLLTGRAGLAPSAVLPCDELSKSLPAIKPAILYPPGRMQLDSLLSLLYAGRALEVVSGKDVRQLLTDEIFEPLGMDPPRDAIEALEQGGLISTLESCPSYRPFLLRAGLQDLARFIAALVAEDPGILGPHRDQLVGTEGPSCDPASQVGLGGMHTVPFVDGLYAGFWEDHVPTSQGDTLVELLVFPQLHRAVLAVVVGATDFDVATHAAYEIGMEWGKHFAPLGGALPSERWSEYEGTFVAPLEWDGKGTLEYRVSASGPTGLQLEAHGGTYPIDPGNPDPSSQTPDLFVHRSASELEILRFWRDEKDSVFAISGCFGDFGPPAFRSN